MDSDAVTRTQPASLLSFLLVCAALVPRDQQSQAQPPRLSTESPAGSSVPCRHDIARKNTDRTRPRSRTGLLFCQLTLRPVPRPRPFPWAREETQRRNFLHFKKNKITFFVSQFPKCRTLPQAEHSQGDASVYGKAMRQSPSALPLLWQHSARRCLAARRGGNRCRV